MRSFTRVRSGLNSSVKSAADAALAFGILGMLLGVQLLVSLLILPLSLSVLFSVFLHVRALFGLPSLNSDVEDLDDEYGFVFVCSLAVC